MASARGKQQRDEEGEGGMTCIVGLVHDKGVTIGGDSRCTAGWVHTNHATSTPKVFRVADMIIGSTGTHRMCQLIQFALVKPEHPEGMDCIAYLVTHFANAVRDCLKAAGHAEKEKDRESYDGALLIGYRERLFSMGGDYAIDEDANSYCAVGSGQEVALGSMHTSARMGELLSPEKRITWALEAAATFSNGVGGPFVIETLASNTAQQESEAA